MPPIITSGIRDCTHLNIVSVIASFDTSGNIKPLYVRIGENSLQIHSARIKSSCTASICFQCQIADRNILKPLDLTYFATDKVWTIPK